MRPLRARTQGPDVSLKPLVRKAHRCSSLMDVTQTEAEQFQHLAQTADAVAAFASREVV